MPKTEDTPLSLEEIETKILDRCKDAIERILKGFENSSEAEKSIYKIILALGCLFYQLYLMSSQKRLDLSTWLDSGLFYQRKDLVGRTINSLFGEVRYWRICLEKKRGGNVCIPLDETVGLTRDNFTPGVINKAIKLVTRSSFSVSAMVFSCFLNWSPSTKTLEELALGLGREAKAYMEEYNYEPTQDELLVIEIDGKATPTATKEELSKRRGKRKKEKCCCQRHRGQENRKKNKRIRRKKGDKSKNGRSITLAVMYTLRKGNDGLYHGPYNKILWGSYAPRKVMLAWARRHATKRGFGPGTSKMICSLTFFPI